MHRRRFLKATAALLASALPLAPARGQFADDARWLYDDILRDRMPLMDGNPQGNVAVIEFFDYQCAFCRQMHPVLRKLVAEDSRLLLVYKEWPARNEISDFAARSAIAARWQDRYPAAHDALMRLRGRMTRESVLDALAAAGIDMERLERDGAEQFIPIERILRQTGSQARSLRLEGTPGFVIGGGVHFGALDEAALRRKIAEARRTTPA